MRKSVLTPTILPIVRYLDKGKVMIATMSSKGQVTFPKVIREQLKLEAGDKVEFIITENGQLLVVPKTASVKQLKGFLPKPRKAISLAAMEAAIAKGAIE